jgi:hypothetical protein
MELVMFGLIAVAVVVALIGGPRQSAGTFGRRMGLILGMIALLLTTAFFTIIIETCLGVHKIDLHNLAFPEIVVVSIFILRNAAGIKRLWSVREKTNG